MRLAGAGDGGRREGATISAGRPLNRPGLPLRSQGRGLWPRTQVGRSCAITYVR